jgi:hypothetical protein
MSRDRPLTSSYGTVPPEEPSGCRSGATSGLAFPASVRKNASVLTSIARLIRCRVCRALLHLGVTTVPPDRQVGGAPNAIDAAFWQRRAGARRRGLRASAASIAVASSRHYRSAQPPSRSADLGTTSAQKVSIAAASGGCWRAANRAPAYPRPSDAHSGLTDSLRPLVESVLDCGTWEQHRGRHHICEG